jgi:hypothetical protein
MAEWIEFNETYVLGAMPSDVATAYGAWLTAHPAKVGRLGEMVVYAADVERQPVGRPVERLAARGDGVRNVDFLREV